MSQIKDLQVGIEKFFKDKSDTLFIMVINTLFYDSKYESPIVQEMIDNFMFENGLSVIYEKYKHDANNTKSYFLKTTLSERQIMEDLTLAFLSASHNRFNQLVIKINKSNG